MTALFMIAVEPSGDHLGAQLMKALRKREPGISFRGVGGPAMAAEGVESLFPISDLAVMGFSGVIRNLQRFRIRIREAAEAILANPPDAIVMVDSYGFSAEVAKRIRGKLPTVPIIKYVSPQVWAWRQGRARKMRGFFDHVLTLFPFEPEVLRNLGGPPSTYVGHPLIERLSDLRPSQAEQERRQQKPPVLVVMPGSRRAEVAHLANTFGKAVSVIIAKAGAVDVVLPTLPHIRPLVEAALEKWPVRPRVIDSEPEKLAAIRTARAAIAASGTASLELALARVPHVGAYRVRAWEAFLIRRLAKISNVLLPNILLGSVCVPELLQENCTEEKVVAAVMPLILGGVERERQIEGFARLDAILETGGEPPSQRAAATILELLGNFAAMQR